MKFGFSLVALFLSLIPVSTVFGQNTPEVFRVEDRSFIAPETYRHGYYMFRCKITNIDKQKSHEATIRSSYNQKKISLAPGASVITCMPIPANGSYQHSVDIYSERFPSTREYSFRLPEFYIWRQEGSYDSLQILICRSLKKCFSDCKCTFADKNCQYWPTDRLDYSIFDLIILSSDEMIHAPEKVVLALEQYVLAGGNLWVFCSGKPESLDSIKWIKEMKSRFTPIEKTSYSPHAALDIDVFLEKEKSKRSEEGLEISPDDGSDDSSDDGSDDESENKSPRQAKKYPAWTKINEYKIDAQFWYPGFGQFVVFAVSPEAFITQTGVPNNYYLSSLAASFMNISNRSNSNLWFRSKSREQSFQEFPVIDNIDIPRRGIALAIILFAILAGPVNVFILTRKNRRILLLVTVPLLSFIFAGGILVYSILADGFQTTRRICTTTYLDQRQGQASTIACVGYYARTTARHIVFDCNSEIHSGLDQSGNIKTTWTQQQELSSSWIIPRTPTYFSIRKTEITRLKMSFDFDSSAPAAVNGLGQDVFLLYVRDKNGKLWKANDIKAGQKTPLIPVASGEKSRVFEYERLISGREHKQPLKQPLYVTYEEPVVNKPIPADKWLVLSRDPDGKQMSSDLNNYFLDGDWYQAKLTDSELFNLNCNSYVAILKNGGPFIEKGISYSQDNKCQTIVYGIY